MKHLWIQEAGIRKHKGSLHHQLGIPMGKKIPPKLLSNIADAKIGRKVRGIKVTKLLKRRAVLAVTLKHLR